MARKPRIHFAGAFYHVMLRGNAGDKIFYVDEDKPMLCLLLQEASNKYSCVIHAFCFMSNHMHLLVEVGETPLSKFVQNFAFRYAMRINKRENRSGHIFQGRFKAILVNNDIYLKNLVRYIHLNPLHANLVKDPDVEWWSSHQDYLGNIRFPWIDSNKILGLFDENIEKAVSIYHEYLCEEIPSESEKKYCCGKIDTRIMGDKYFVEQIYQRASCDNILVGKIMLDEIVGFVCKQYNINSNHLFSKSSAHNLTEPRAMIGWLCMELNVISLVGLSKLFNIHSSSISKKIKFLNEYKLELMHQLKFNFKNAKLRGLTP